VGRGKVSGAGAIGGFLFTDTTGPRYLTSLLDTAPGHWFICEAWDINDTGQVVAEAGDFVRGVTRAVRLDPIGGCTSNCLRSTGLSLRVKQLSSSVTVAARAVVTNEASASVPDARVTVQGSTPKGAADKVRGDELQRRDLGAGLGPHGKHTATVSTVSRTGWTFDAANSTARTKSVTA